MPNIMKSFEPSHVGIHRKALVEHYQMSAMCQGFSHFRAFCHHFILTKLATSSERVNIAADLWLTRCEWCRKPENQGNFFMSWAGFEPYGQWWSFQCWGHFYLKHKDAKIFENHLNPIMLVFIGYCFPWVLSDEYPCARVSVILYWQN